MSLARRIEVGCGGGGHVGFGMLFAAGLLEARWGEGGSVSVSGAAFGRRAVTL